MFGKVGIIGVGLIGGSLAGALKGKKIARRVTGFDRDEENLKIALERNLIDDYSLTLQEVIEGAEIIILSTPVRSFPGIVEEIKNYLVENQIISDVGSVKRKVIEEVEKRIPEGVFFVPAHPIAGTEKSGAQSASPSLFENKKCIITPGNKCSPEAVEKIKKMWSGVGMEIVEMDPIEHDLYFAYISHLPHIIAYSLVKCVGEKSEELHELLKYTAGGFRDFTRIAESPFEMWRDICLWNGDFIEEAINYYEKFLRELKFYIQKKDIEKLEETFKKASLIKKSIG